MHKELKLSLALLAIVLIGLFLSYVFLSPNTEHRTPNTTSTPTPPPNTEYQIPNTTPPVILYSPPDKTYQLVFVPQHNQYVISILKTPFEDVRKQVEPDILNQLRVSSADACKLNVMISSPYFVTGTKTPTYTKFSFCN
jgi:hypothetical protein